MPENKKKFLKSTAIIGIATFSSQVLGLVRTSLLSAFYGATESEGLADCYSAAFKLPDIIYTLVVSGIISIILIPYFIKGLEQDKININKACSGFLNLFFIIISFFIFIGFILAPIIVKNFLLPGWNDKEKIDLTIKLTRIIFAQTLFITLSSVFGSYLNALEKFTAYSLAMLSYNIGIIAGIIFLSPFIGIEGVAYGVVFGSFLHFLFQFLGSIKNGFKYYFVLPKIDKELIDLTLNALPRIITLGSSQIVRFFLVNISSFIWTGAIFIFDNVENIGMVPYGLLAISISTASFPIFIKYYNENRWQVLIESLFDKLRMLFFFIIPISFFFIVFRVEIVDILLGYKNYLPKDVNITAEALIYYMIGIPFFSATLILVKFYYAIRRSFLPMFIAILSSCATIVVSFLLVKIFAVSSLSIGRTTGNIIQFLLLILFIFVIKKENFSFKNEAKEILFITLISLFFLFLGLILKQYINFNINLKINYILRMAIIGIPFGFFYFLITFFLKIPEATFILDFINKFKNKFKSKIKQ
ncbi:MAG TPA: murein biosynthesis integral membrane protein MurJ [Spirochaetota bacterium]|nr:murein biosynthesis integral membrane protein MurJ [Spirochaetota bacterium]HOL57485.1 murein biosynthesis integral membrane protein MurJ [Spirochaetota bacterium]HPP05032.1 murein biosynthesis integral membrane protein MurJ [Spirochaetota bacterium]